MLLWLQGEEVCCYESSEECRTLHGDSGGWDQTPEICKFFTGCSQIDPMLWIIGANDVTQSILVLPSLYSHESRRFTYSKSRQFVCSHLFPAGMSDSQLGSTVKNEPNCFSQQTIICLLHLLVNISRSESDNSLLCCFIIILVFVFFLFDCVTR